MSIPRRFISWLGKLRRNPLTASARLLNLARAQLLFREAEMGEGVSATGWVRAEGPGMIRLASGTTFLGGMIPTEVISHSGATVQIGEGGLVNYGVSLEAHQQITIGRRCLLASFVRVSDQGGGRAAPVVIGDDVWLAHGVIVEPGVTVGEGSVVAAGSVVTADVPPGSLASGNPATWVPLTPRADARPTWGS
jgi:acetyltransferase-like isoleucine patch superfamily enzyme